ncbi:TRAP transporter substrate-binding protein DctP [Cloacibacillus sp.]|uniref:TRAP transporter substrate-binding protein DctP n=1 Tax=Cloacibacillus sp. TaxID=2049023 RepID=UPI0025C0CBE7|nr:TRAP transporter substrate-binding protein DctP [Cloacibacillus sp.]MCC8057252.1 TRAP transporter substrate-binding protein DctP [Cloacibacillus sp.]
MKKSIKSVLVMLAVAVMLVSSTTAIFAKDWKLSHTRPTGTPLDNDAKYFVDNVKKVTNGRINIVVFPASQLGDYTVVQERLSIGDVEMMLCCPSSTVDKRLALTTMPYLATSWEELEYLYNKDGGEARKIIAEILDKQDIHLLGIWPALCSGIGFTKEPKSPGDPNVQKNLKIRVMPLKVSELTGEALGYMATPLAFGDIFTALQTGMIDGVIGTGPEGNWSQYRDLIKYYCDQKIFYEVFPFMINKSIWNSLSKEDRNALTKIADSMEEKRWDEVAKEHNMYIKKLRENGTKIVTFTTGELDIMRKKVQEKVWPSIPKEFPPDLQKRIIDSLSKMKKQ